VTVGGSTFLFQFVVPPPPRPRLALPPALRSSAAARTDWRLFIVVACSFLLHFGALGAMYGDWADDVVRDDDVTARLVQTWTPERPPPVEVAPHEPEQTPSAEESSAPQVPAPRERKTHEVTPSSTRAPVIDELTREARAMRIGILRTLDGRPNLARALAPDSTAPVDLNELAEQAAGITHAPSPVDGIGAGPIEPGPAARWRDLHPTETASVASTAGSARRVDVPPYKLPAPLPVASVAMADAEAVIRHVIEPAARRCYERGLQSNPALSGRVVISLSIAPSGEVDAASPEGLAGLSVDVADCIARAARRARFTSPGPSGASLRVPFSFVLQSP
jgi:hypothetical protein